MIMKHLISCADHSLTGFMVMRLKIAGSTSHFVSQNNSAANQIQNSIA